MNREQALDMLWTGDIPDDLRPDEYVKLLGDVRDLYKELYNKVMLSKSHHERVEQNHRDDVSRLNSDMLKLQLTCSNYRDRVEELRMSRKLTWRERFKGFTETQSSSSSSKSPKS
jgi:hypothetical protein